MNTLLLQPSDVLFFRDGRPMSGSLSGHGAAWPLPTVTNSALHAALHRAQVDGKINDIKVHGHNHHRSSGDSVTNVRNFGSLLTVGPFPVSSDQWFFPRPLDAGRPGSTAVTLLPLKANENGPDIAWQNHSTLPKPLAYATANTETASKDTPTPWWDHAAWQHYLDPTTTGTEPVFHKDSDFSDTEFTYGIGIDETTGTQDGERFYSAHYLRLREGWKLGLLASAVDKIANNPANTRDLIQKVFPNTGTQTSIIAGGQQRICTVERKCGTPISLPIGRTDGFLDPKDNQFLVKWVLLAPAIFTAIPDKDKQGNSVTPHSGGWLPNWIAEKNQTLEGVPVEAGSVLLLDGPGKEKAKRKKLTAGKRINATLVAAIIGKPIPVTGYALFNDADPDRATGPKSTHLAVPAGSVYYFQCVDEPAAKALAAALNWHGSSKGTQIQNRRSTLMGEKGFGLGVCGTWSYHEGKLPT